VVAASTHFPAGLFFHLYVKELHQQEKLHPGENMGIQEAKQYSSTKSNLALWKIKIEKHATPYNSECPQPTCGK
jgi:hypothetical protein